MGHQDVWTTLLEMCRASMGRQETWTTLLEMRTVLKACQEAAMGLELQVQKTAKKQQVMQTHQSRAISAWLLSNRVLVAWPLLSQAHL